MSFKLKCCETCVLRHEYLNSDWIWCSRHMKRYYKLTKCRNYKKEKTMGKNARVTKEQAEFIIKNCATMTLTEMCEAQELSPSQVNNVIKLVRKKLLGACANVGQEAEAEEIIKLKYTFKRAPIVRSGGSASQSMLAVDELLGADLANL